MIERLRREGCAIVYITHRLHEYFDLTDRVVVLRDGRVVAEEGDRRSRRGAAGAAHGRPQARAPVRAAGRQTRADESHCSRFRASRPVACTGWTSRSRPGRSSAWRAKPARDAPAWPEPCSGGGPTRARFRLDGRALSITSVASAIRAGIALVPEDRKREGLVGTMSVGRTSRCPRGPRPRVTASVGWPAISSVLAISAGASASVQRASTHQLHRLAVATSRRSSSPSGRRATSSC